MTTKDAMAALDNLDEARTLGVDPLSEDLATLRAFVTEMGPVREVLERGGSVSGRAFCNPAMAIIPGVPLKEATTYTAACAAALEAVDGAGAGEEEE